MTRLLITNKTELTQKATLFGDGEDGYFVQSYSVFADGLKTGVEILVTGNLGKNNTQRKFTVGNKEFDDFKEACVAAGHTWERTK